MRIDVEITHWNKVLKKYSDLQLKRPMTSDEYQQMHYAKHKINELLKKRYPTKKLSGDKDS